MAGPGPHIIKIGAVIQDRRGRLLVVRKVVPGRNTYIIPGGRPDGAELPTQTLERELREELGVTVAHASPFGEYTETSEFEDATLSMTVYDVDIDGEPTLQSASRRGAAHAQRVRRQRWRPWAHGKGSVFPHGPGVVSFRLIG